MQSSMAGPTRRRSPLAPSRTACGSSSSTTASPFDPTVAARKADRAGRPRISGSADTAPGLLKKFSRRMTYRRDDGHNRLVLEFDADAGPLSRPRAIANERLRRCGPPSAPRARSANFPKPTLAFLIEAGEIRAFEPEAILMVQGEPSDMRHADSRAGK